MGHEVPEELIELEVPEVPSELIEAEAPEIGEQVPEDVIGLDVPELVDELSATEAPEELNMAELPVVLNVNLAQQDLRQVPAAS